jgi:hypothetical protein
MVSSPERLQKPSEKQHLQRRIDLLSWIDLLSGDEEVPDADPIDRSNLVSWQSRRLLVGGSRHAFGRDDGAPCKLRYRSGCGKS